jgi:hypothetical protein
MYAWFYVALSCQSHGSLWGSSALGTVGHRLRFKVSEYDRFPPVVNGWGTIHLISDMVSLVRTEEQGPLTKQELNPGAIHTFTLAPYDRRGQIGFYHLSARPASLLDLGAFGNRYVLLTPGPQEATTLSV